METTTKRSAKIRTGTKTKNKKNVLCEAFGSRCTICGGHFEEGDDVCGLGKHQIGEIYSV